MPGKKPGPRYSAAFKRRVYDDFLAADLPRGYGEIWYETKAEEIGVSAQTVRTWIAYYRELDRECIGGSSTPAQNIASLVGATIAEAVRTLGRNLKAHNVKVITDRDGNVVERVYTPNHEAQNSAAEKILKIHGAFAPEKHSVDVRAANDPSVMSDEQLDAELERFQGAKSQRSTVTEGTAHPALPEGSTLLVNAGDEDV